MSFPEFINEDSIVWLTRELPNPSHIAEALLMVQRHLARELLAAHRTETGWKFRYDENSTMIRELRSLGLCESGGEKPKHPGGWHLTAWGLIVRNRLLSLISTRELEFSLENDEAAE